MRTLIQFLLLAATTVAVACGENRPADFGVTGASVVSDARLAEAIRAYYEAEASGDWPAAYGKRPKPFRDTVDLVLYQKTMAHDWAGRNLLAVEIESARVVAARAYVKVRITETKESLFGVGIRSIFTEDTRWDHDSGEWYAYEPGTRMHISLNNAIVVYP